jgi:chromosome segregation protein
MYLRAIELSGFKSFAKKTRLELTSSTAAIVGPNGSGKSNIAEAFRFVLGEQSMKAMRGKKGEDLIWSGSDAVGRANRASVSITFDNKSRLLDIDFDEVTLERVVFRDGASEYRINESPVRLKDITELLAAAHIGASGHHMISQGEADRILSASPLDRRAMVEDALGLRVFEYKKRESERKLERTIENMKEATVRKRELVPHLKYLERQAERLQRAQEMATELALQYAVYKAREEMLLVHEESRLARAAEAPKHRLSELEAQLVQAKKNSALDDETSAYDKQFADFDEQLRSLQKQRSDAERALGRIEGQLSVLAHTHKTEADVPHSAVRGLLPELADIAQTLDTHNIDKARTLLGQVIARVRALVEDPQEDSNAAQRAELTQERARIETSIQEYSQRIDALTQKRAALSQQFDALRKEARDAEREVFTLMTEINQVRSRLYGIEREQQDVVRARESYERVCTDAQAFVHTGDVPGQTLPTRMQQDELLRSVERLHARLDEAGGVDTATLQEYEQTKARVEFLDKEITDLEESKAHLETLIAGLDTELTERFRTGVTTINDAFSNFFGILFNGGSANLFVVRPEKKKPIVDEETGEEVAPPEDDEEPREGVNIKVHIPRKKVTSLDVLSGGERALTSIALIFAMSQVHPPPFLILDETDAALDEANSKRYADMVRLLSQKSQLILITHNRATMSAAGELYGITMGRDGVSTVLSVKLEEAVKVAK